MTGLLDHMANYLYVITTLGLAHVVTSKETAHIKLALY
jgi:hypothetical protein